MNSHVVSDGGDRLRRSASFAARLGELRASIKARYATELAEAGVFHRLVLRCRIALEYRCDRRKLLPSPKSLYHRR